MKIPTECARTTLLCVVLPLLLHAQAPPDATPAPPPLISNNRILGIIPNFQTVSEPGQPYVPLHMRDKWWLFVKETTDPFTFGASAAGAAIAQIDNGNPKYGEGWKPYLQRFGAAEADVATQNFFSDAFLASLLHEDPRYFRMGPGSPIALRIAYAMSRLVIIRRDSGRNGFNFSGIMGTGMGIVLSDAYYPRQSVGGREVESRFLTSFASTSLGNLLPEFWPDIKEKLDKLKHRRSLARETESKPTR